MNMTRHTESVEVIFKDQRRRRWSLAEKSALVRRTYEPGMSVSLWLGRKALPQACCSSGVSLNGKAH